MRAPALAGPRLILRPVEQRDLDALHGIVCSPAVARWWGPGDSQSLARWVEDDGETLRWSVVLAEAVVGMVQASEEADPDYRHAGIDIFLDTAVHGRGLGGEAIRIVAGWLFGERGHHRLVIDPAAANERAIRCYERVGFRRVGVMRGYWLDHETGAWADGLLLDLLRGELR